MLTIDNIYENLIEINKSKFYSFAYPVASEEECKEILSEFRKKYKDATHICFFLGASSCTAVWVVSCWGAGAAVESEATSWA